ncbi:MAG TPA: type II CAAX endopeptidase family protein [Acidimicrobiia bacterium]|jgi:membrane protease YdiL (CAAX protease family)
MSTLTTAVSLAAYAVGFQTLVYLLLPVRFRVTWAPLVTSMVGAGLVAVSAIWFGSEAMGLAGPDGGLLAAWGSGTVLTMSTVGLVMLSRPQLRDQLADPRMTAMTTRQAAAQILVRIPVMTALIEEAVFRGVLHAALIAIYPEPIALWGGAALFGLWHIGPGLDQARSVNRRSLAGIAHVLITVIATTIAGAGLVWLRIETGSIWIPVIVHAGVNMTLAGFARVAGKSGWAGMRRPAVVPET